jgi:DNA-binding response OmpR family regulator
MRRDRVIDDDADIRLLLRQLLERAGFAVGYGVSIYVGYLRRKLAPDAPDSAPVETVRGFGYRYARA